MQGTHLPLHILPDGLTVTVIVTLTLILTWGRNQLGATYLGTYLRYLKVLGLKGHNVRRQATGVRQ